MTIHFHIEYRTAFGEELSLCFMDNDEVKTLRMTTIDGVDWWCDLSLRTSTPNLIYYYKVTTDGTFERSEWLTVKHVLNFTCTAATEYHVYDRWNDMPEDSYLYSSALPTASTIRFRSLSSPHPLPARCVSSYGHRNSATESVWL